MSEISLNVELGGGRAGEAITATPKVFTFQSAARTVSVHNGGSNVLYAACGDATAAGLAARITAGNALAIPAGRYFTYESTYPRLRALALAAADGETTEATIGVF